MTDEGYIKFSCNLIHHKLPSFLVMKDINLIRSRLLELGYIGSVGDISFGNISFRVDYDQFLITGSNTGAYPELNPEHFSIVQSCDIENNSLTCLGEIPASSESLTHYGAYLSNEKIKSVIHIHSKELWEKYIDILPCSDKSARYGTPEIAISVRNIMEKEISIRPNDSAYLIVMGGHYEGLLAAGKSLLDVYDLIKQFSDE